MNEIKNLKIIIKPYLQTSLRVLLILLVIMIIFAIVIFFINPKEIEIKNSNRRKIDEKIKKMEVG